MADYTVALQLKADTGTASREIGRFSDNVVNTVKSMSSRSVGHITKLSQKFTAGLGGAISKVGRALTSLKTLAIGALVGWGIQRLAGSFLSIASDMEKYETTLGTVLKSEEKAAEMMQWISDFAATTPFEIPELVEASTRLEAYGMSAQKYMKTLGDASGALGKNIMQAVEMVADASQGEFERMKEFGLRATDVAKKAGFETVQEMNSSRENLAKGTEALMQLLEERYSGGMAKLAATFQGMISNLKDQMTRFKMMVMEAGVFEYIKTKIGEALEKINEWAESGKLQEWAETTATKIMQWGGTVVSVVGNAVEAIGWIPTAFFSVKEAINKTMSLLSAFGAAAVDVAAFTAAVVNPYWAVKIAAKGAMGKDLGTALRETFPILAEARDKMDAIGQSQYDAARKSAESAQNFADWGVQIEGIAGKIKAAGESMQEGFDVPLKTDVDGDQAIEKIVKIGDTWTNIKTHISGNPGAPQVDISQGQSALKKLMTDYDDMKRHIESKPPVVTVEAKIKKSPAQPWSSGISEMKSDLSGVSDTINSIFDASDFSGIISSIQSSIRAVRDFGPLTSEVLWNAYAGPATKEAYSYSKELLDLQMAYLKSAVKPTQAKTVSAGDGGGSSNVMGDVVINISAVAQTPEDWRRIVRNHIKPELDKLNA